MASPSGFSSVRRRSGRTKCGYTSAYGYWKLRRNPTHVESCAYGGKSATFSTKTTAPPWPSGGAVTVLSGHVSFRSAMALSTSGVMVMASGVVVVRNRDELRTGVHRHIVFIPDELGFLRPDLDAEDEVELDRDVLTDRRLLNGKPGRPRTCDVHRLRVDCDGDEMRRRRGIRLLGRWHVLSGHVILQLRYGRRIAERQFPREYST